MAVPFEFATLYMLAFAGYDITRKERLWANKKRKNLFELTEKVPGITPAEAQGHLGYAKSTVIHHVRILVIRDVLLRVCVGHSMYLFPVGTPYARKIAVLMERGMRLFAKAVVERPGTNLAGIEKRTGTDRKVLRRYAEALVQAGLVEDTGADRRHSYEPTAALAPALERVEAIMAAKKDLAAGKDLTAGKDLAAKRDLGTVHATTSGARTDG